MDNQGDGPEMIQLDNNSRESSESPRLSPRNRHESANFQRKALESLNLDGNDSDTSDGYPIEKSEQMNHDLMENGLQAKPSSKKVLEYYNKYQLPMPPVSRLRTESITDNEQNEYQKINISSRESTGMSRESFQKIAHDIMGAIEMRQRYMANSHQTFQPTADRHLRIARGRAAKTPTDDSSLDLDVPYHPPPEDTHVESPYIDLKVDQLPKNWTHTWKMRHGIIDIRDEDNNPLRYIIRPDTHEFLDNHAQLLKSMSNGQLRTYCWRRLQFLSHKYNLHHLLNETLEIKEIKELPHRDFYNCRKVDNHIHAAAMMNQKHLLRFIKKTLKTDADLVVTKDGKKLSEVFNQIGISAYDLSVDLLDCHADTNVYHRFDKFNSKYNPLGQSVLRELYIKTDNHINGRYFAQIAKQVAEDFEDAKYQHAEPRLSIYGREYDEFSKLAKWAVSNDVFSNHISFHEQGRLNHQSFYAFIRGKEHPELARFLENVVGFDSVDDESRHETSQFTAETPTPDKYNMLDNPVYSYYLWYMYANISVINQIRKERGMNTFALRPHCGEAGHIYHTATAFLLSENINHGINLRKSPVMEYFYYLCQIGISMSPMSNNHLFLPYSKSPFKEFFERGQNIALSTDDPLQFHLTKEPLIEEYSVAAQVWKLNSVDMSEIARNSVLMSGFKDQLKQYWLGPLYRREGIEGNDNRRTNVPPVRCHFRFETLDGELSLISSIIKETKNNNP
ncbi:Oidioi.mRNA.OKI2018_I69.chr2.g5916.t2.cds [Oikopleura dioica]|uniref:AMP deaminase n=1 Tax=Oikopleura dioica TaxID=34765 RepID=A0ABN7T8D6_OIKDI|nr:Oidioi.mRNA.OKI2018_I69.chr2.g5916.t2.cds [Oikopleura dioica]